MKLAETLRALAPDRLRENEPMSRHTTFRVGGPAELMFFPASVEEVQFALAAAREEKVDVHLVGNGSNLLVRDGGLRGLTIVMGEAFQMCAWRVIESLPRRARRSRGWPRPRRRRG